jgi:RNA polymerase sigma-70 factor, ECF subfamily
MRNHTYNTDEELFRSIRCGEPTALRILFERYFVPLCSFSSRFVKTAHLAEEVVSDVFLKIWLRRETIEIKTSGRTYLYAAVRNQSLNYVMKNQGYFEDFIIADGEEIISDLHAERFVQYEELKEDIDSLIRQLPKKRQIIFRMNRLDGLSYKEIAEILSISVNTVQNQMVEAVKFLSHRYHRYK